MSADYEICPKCKRAVEPEPVGRFEFPCRCGWRWGDRDPVNHGWGS